MKAQVLNHRKSPPKIISSHWARVRISHKKSYDLVGAHAKFSVKKKYPCHITCIMVRFHEIFFQALQKSMKSKLHEDYTPCVEKLLIVHSAQKSTSQCISVYIYTHYQFSIWYSFSYDLYTYNMNLKALTILVWHSNKLAVTDFPI